MVCNYLDTMRECGLKPNHQHWSMVLFCLCWNDGIRLAYSSPLERVFVCSGGWWVWNDDGYREAGRNGSCFLHLITVSNWITFEIRKHDHSTTDLFILHICGTFCLTLMHLFSYLLESGVFQHLFSISLLRYDIVSTTPVLLCKDSL